MLKHIGKHSDRKVVILYRTVPNEDHMCLLSYSDLLPRMLHDSIMKSLEGAVGQQADNFAEALFRTLLPDGRNILEVLHKEGFMKKVATNQIIMTPTPSTTIRLDELNKLLAEMALGEDAIKRMAEIDAQSGLQAKKRDNTPKRNRDVGEPAAPAYNPPLQADENSVLSDEVIAAQQLAQADRMRKEALSMIAEATRLEKEAAILSPVVVKTVKAKAAKPAKVEAPVAADTAPVAKKKAGRPSNASKKNGPAQKAA